MLVLNIFLKRILLALMIFLAIPSQGDSVTPEKARDLVCKVVSYIEYTYWERSVGTRYRLNYNFCRETGRLEAEVANNKPIAVQLFAIVSQIIKNIETSPLVYEVLEKTIKHFTEHQAKLQLPDRTPTVGLSHAGNAVAENFVNFLTEPHGEFVLKLGEALFARALSLAPLYHTLILGLDNLSSLEKKISN